MVETSIQLWGTAITTSAKPKPRRLGKVNAAIQFRRGLAQQILAGYPEMHIA